MDEHALLLQKKLIKIAREQVRRKKARYVGKLALAQQTKKSTPHRITTEELGLKDYRKK